MSDTSTPVSKPEPDEFDFSKSPEESSRGKRRSLKTRKVALKPAARAPEAARELEKEAAPLSAKEVKPAFQPDPRDDDDAEINGAVRMTEPAPVSAAPTAARPAQNGPRLSSTSTPSASPHGTRPATLYYSSSPRKEKETPAPQPTPMKTTSTFSAAPSASTPKPTVPTSGPVFTTTTSAARPASVVDYRTNVERQAREQKSVGSILSYLVYALIGLFVLGAALAGYGTWVLSRQINEQSVTLGDLDTRLTGQTKTLADQNQALADQLKLTIATLTTAQNQIARQQELITRQQAAIGKLAAANQTISAANQETAAALRAERQNRQEEESSLRTRLKNLEYQAPPSHKY